LLGLTSSEGIKTFSSNQWSRIDDKNSDRNREIKMKFTILWVDLFSAKK
jgi:predicted DNA-binding protein YlxM (UPF0122 family)